MQKTLFVLSAFIFFFSVAFTLDSVFPHQVFSASANIGLGGSEPEFTPTPTGIGNSGPMITTTPTTEPTATPTTIPTPTPDTENPVVFITSPVNGGHVTKNSTITIGANATDNVSVVNVKFYVNGTLRCTDTLAPYSCQWSVPKKANVTYTLNTQAVDPSGNIGSHTIYVVSR